MSQAEVLRIVTNAAAGRPPAADGKTEFIDPGDTRADAVLGFYGHFVVAAPVDAIAAAPFVPDGDFNAPMGLAFLTWLTDQLGSQPGSLDVVFAHSGVSAPPSVALHELEPASDHARVARARTYRHDCRVFVTEDEAGVLIIGRGVGNRLEMAYEVDEDAQGRGLGTALAAAAPTLIDPGEFLFAATAPGNVASIRCLLSAGYRPTGSEVLFLRDQD